MRILILIFIASSAYGQSIPPGSNTIVVHGVTFIQVCNSLLDSGYTIDKKDNDLQTVSTKRKTFPRFWNAEYDIVVRVKDSTAYFIGYSYSSILDRERVYQHTNKKGKVYPKSLLGYPFRLIDQFVKCFNKPVRYSIQ